MRKTVRMHDTNGLPKAPNKRRALKLGAILAGATLIVGAISLFDTASAYPSGNPRRAAGIGGLGSLTGHRRNQSVSSLPLERNW